MAGFLDLSRGVQAPDVAGAVRQGRLKELQIAREGMQNQASQMKLERLPGQLDRDQADQEQIHAERAQRIEAAAAKADQGSRDNVMKNLQKSIMGSYKGLTDGTIKLEAYKPKLAKFLSTQFPGAGEFVHEIVDSIEDMDDVDEIYRRMGGFGDAKATFGVTADGKTERVSIDNQGNVRDPDSGNVIPKGKFINFTNKINPNIEAKSFSDVPGASQKSKGGLNKEELASDQGFVAADTAINSMGRLFTMLESNPQAAGASGAVANFVTEGAAALTNLAGLAGVARTDKDKQADLERFSSKFTSAGIDDARKRSAIVDLAYAFAKANDPGGRVTDKDFNSAKDMFRGGANSIPAIKITMRDASERLMYKMGADGRFGTLDKDRFSKNYGELQKTFDRVFGENTGGAKDAVDYSTIDAKAFGEVDFSALNTKQKQAMLKRGKELGL